MEDLSEVIEKNAGVQVRQSGGLGSFSTISLRGCSSQQVMVFLDGILLNDASGGGVDLSNISISDIDAIEIFRGMTPIHFSKASIGGAVNIRTMRSKRGLKASITTGYGSFNSRKIAGFLNHKPGRGDYLICVDYLASDNDFTFLNNNGTFWNEDDDKEERRNNAQMEQKNLLAKFGFDLTTDVRVDLANNRFAKKQGFPSWDNNKNTQTSLTTERNISTLKLTIDNIGRYTLNSFTTINYSQKKEEYDDRQGHIGLGSQHNEYTTERLEGSFFLEFFNTSHPANFKLDLQREIYNSEDLLKKKNPFHCARILYALGLQKNYGLFQDSLYFIPTLRYTFIKDELKEDINAETKQLERKSRDKTYFSPHLGIKYVPLEWATFKTNIGRYCREPSFFELFGDRGFFIGNEELQEEKGTNFDAGFEIHHTKQNYPVNLFSSTTAYCNQDVDDLITFVYDAQGVGRAVNISKAKIHGIEAEIKMHFLKNFRFIGNYTKQETKNLSQVSASYGKKLPGIFENSYMGKIEFIFKGLKLYCEEVVEEGMYYSEDNFLKAGNKREINAGLSFLFHSMLLTFEAKNLKDAHYEDFNGYPLPGRSFYGSLKINF